MENEVFEELNSDENSQDKVESPSDNEPSVTVDEDTPKEAISDEKEELAGGMENNGNNIGDETPKEKVPLFYIEPKKTGCSRDDKMLLLSKKVGFIGIVTCLLLSILFGALTRVWDNAFNLLFVGLALICYSVQNILDLKASSSCNCADCTANKSKKQTLAIVCMVASLVLIVLFALRTIGIF